MITVTDEFGNKYTVDPQYLNATEDEWYRGLPHNTPVQIQPKFRGLGKAIQYKHDQGTAPDQNQENEMWLWSEIEDVRPVPPPDNYAWARSKGYEIQVRWASGFVGYYRKGDQHAVFEETHLDKDTVIYVGPIPEEGE